MERRKGDRRDWLIVRDRESRVGKIGDILHPLPPESFKNPIHGSLGKTLLVARVNINPSRCEECFGKVCHDPLITVLGIAVPKTLPVRAGDDQPTFSAPIPSARIAWRRGIDTVDGFNLVRVDGLVPNHIIDFLNP